MHLPLSTASRLSILSLLTICVGAAPSDAPNTLVKLPYGSFQGKATGSIIQFLGMPFASPPVGELRFAPPKDPLPIKGIHQATVFGAACLQQETQLAQLPGLIVPPPNTSEDCLFINVIKPANIPSGRKLPVIFYIYGGGFEIGDTSLSEGDALVNRSLALGEPVIFVSANYRVNAFGFLGGKEVKAAGIGNVGLIDQRFALQWVQKYITAFGGDPRKVTIWGESAGAISVGLQMVLNGGNTGGLFHGGIMQSGSPIVLPDILRQQEYFDQLIVDTNCTASADRLKCLRSVPASQLVAAVNRTPSIFSYQSLRLAWQPMVDGKVIVRDPLISLLHGKYARVPFITGDLEDEGTLFAFSTLNITTNTQYLDYAKQNYFPRITDSELQALEQAYPDDVTQGSPFNTGTANAITPQFKRLAALQGDMAFQAPRRFFSQIASKTQRVYGFRYMWGASTPIFGAPHGSDMEEFFGAGNATHFIGADAVVYFTNNGNPNAPKNSISLLGNITWKPWGSSVENPPLFTFIDPAPSVDTTFDTYRADAMKLLNRLLLNEIGNGI